MEYLHSLFDTKIDVPTAVTVGKFDGVHKGHSLLTKDILSMKERGLMSCLITFKNSPRFNVDIDETPALITNKERMFMLEDSGLDYLIECPFDERLMQTSPVDFIDYLINDLNMAYMVSGTDFTFGYKGAGDVRLLKDLSKKRGFEYKVIDKIKNNHRDISSTYIREELEKGNISNVNNMLGYDYFVWGQVVHGKHLGTKIGIPTINIMPDKTKLVPKFGVYVTNIDFQGRIYHGVTNVGTKPSVSNEKIIGIETHILDYTGNLYGEYVRVTFKEFLRPETKFPSVEDLQKQMNIDKLKAKEYFNGNSCYA